ncbi:hypothetical protein A8M77_23245 [Variovorax sp. JS1663]|nr:hypothetical protein A8M77_23245 [Variovorax sp. JS1663]
MGDHVLETLLLSKAVELERALGVMLEADARQQGLKSQHPAIYDTSFHAAGITQHIQCISTQIESLLTQAVEQTAGKLPVSESWHQDLIHLASTATDDREPLLDAAGAKCLKEALEFRHIAWSNYAGDLNPPRVFEHIAITVAPVKAAVTGVRQLFDSSAAP